MKFGAKGRGEITSSVKQDVVLVAAIFAAILMMILPLPTLLVDALIAINFVVSLVVMMVAIFVTTPVDFNIFPSILVVTTIYRLALTISTSRLILLQHDAGRIVSTFGEFVVGGNIAVGLAVFLILTVVQYLVVTKGGERIAEVSARFVLEGLPGKQMSIDADLRANSIDAATAKAQRKGIEMQSRLFGAMDGAMRFVKGDAIAAIIVVLVNLIGGIVIGVVQQDLGLTESVALYAVLSVGDGLISQIPSLMLSLSAAFIVTRVDTEGKQSLAQAISSQVGDKPVSIVAAGFFCLILGLLPGFPIYIFLPASAMLGMAGYRLLAAQKEKGARPTEGEAHAGEDNVSQSATPLVLRLGQGPRRSREVDSKLDEIVQRKRLELGINFPSIKVVVDTEHDELFELVVFGSPAVKLTIAPGKALALCLADQLDAVEGEFYMPWNRRPACWIDPAAGDGALENGIALIPPESVVSTLFDSALDSVAEQFVGIQETKQLLDGLERQFPELVREVQRTLPIVRIAEILRRLMQELVSIRNLRLILEALVEWGPKERDAVLLTEYVRVALKRQIIQRALGDDGRMRVINISERFEEVVRESIRETALGSYADLSPETQRVLQDTLFDTVRAFQLKGVTPIVVCAMDVRRYVRKLTERNLGYLEFLSVQEIADLTDVEVLATVEYRYDPEFAAI